MSSRSQADGQIEGHQTSATVAEVHFHFSHVKSGVPEERSPPAVPSERIGYESSRPGATPAPIRDFGAIKRCLGQLGTRRLVCYLVLVFRIFAGEKMGPTFRARRTRRECLRTHRQSPSRKKTALQNRRPLLGLEPSCQAVVVVVEKLYVTDRIAL